METIRIKSVAKMQAENGRPYLRIVQANSDDWLFVWDEKLFGKLETASGTVAQLDVQRPEGKKPRVMGVGDVKIDAYAPPNGATTASPRYAPDSDRERNIRRQVALKCAVEAAGLAPVELESLSKHIGRTLEMAAFFVTWLEQDDEPANIPF
jgi:hypothetical protein